MRTQNFNDLVSPALALVGDTSSWTEQQWAEHDERVRAQRARHDALLQESERRARRERYQVSGFPLRAIEGAERADEKNPVIAKLAAWEPVQRSSVILAGPVGCGKTVAATWWAMRQPHVPLFMRASTFAASSRYDAKHREMVFSAPALVLDDLGAEYLDDKGSFLTDMDELVDTYYGDRRPLVITTNVSHDKFTSRYGERFVDRMRECGYFWDFKLTSLRPVRRR